MKPLIIAMTLLTGCYALKAEAAPKVITEFNWNAVDIAPFTRKWPVTGGQTFPLGSGFAMNYHGADPISINLRTMGADIASQITSRHYAILGKLKTTTIPAGSYLEMVSYFAPDKTGDPEGIYFSRTLSDSGPSAKLEGTNEGRDFLLPFEATDSQAKLTRLVLNLYLTGPGGVELSDVKLVQYAEPVTAPGPSIPVDTNTATVPDAATLGEGERVEKFDWAQVDKQNVPGGVNVGWNWWPSMGEAAVFAGTVGKEPIDLNLRTVGPSICSKLTAVRYAIVSRLGYENITKGSYLEMLSAYRSANGGPEVTFSSRTTADSGPAAQIEGTDTNRTLVLPFDSTGVKGKLVRIELNLHLAGHGAAHLGQTWLVQYPDEPTKPTVPSLIETQASAVQPSPSELIPVDLKSFLLGVATTIFALASGGVFVVLKRRLARQRREKEMRRIASQDS